MAYELALSTTFWKSRDALDNRERDALADAMEKVQKGLPSVHVHDLPPMPFVAFGVNRDAMRVICKRNGNTLICLYVGAHDETYQWAKRHRVLQVGNYVRIVQTREEEEAERPEVTGPEPTTSGPLATVDDEAFAKLHVHPPTTRLLRELTDEDLLVDLLTHFPSTRGNALLHLATDPADIEGAEREYLAAIARNDEEPSLSDALRHDANSADFWIPDPADEAYRRALRGGFETWRVFLHPTQRQVVRVKSKGAVKVTGGPGTGKTVVALHRAKHLAEGLAAAEPRPILMTTFSSVLTEQLDHQLDLLCGKETPIRERIAARSLVSIAQDVLDAAGLPRELVVDPDDCWAKALAHDASGRGQLFYESEREHVVAVKDAWTEATYLKVKRTGRGSRLDRAGRREVWKVLDAFEQALLAAGGGDVIALTRRATAALRSGEVDSPYAAVVCDEVQDVGASELRFLAALATDPETGALRPDGLTLCGDGHQRIYRVPFRLSACGIDVRGRASRVLRLNYRTTDAIRRAAVALLEGDEGDELEDEGVDPLRGYRSIRRGVPPDHRTFATAGEEADWIAELVRDDPSRLLVLARKRSWITSLRKLLQARGLEPRVLESGDEPKNEDRLLLCTLHRSKGLEAQRVVLAGRQLVPARYPGGGDPADRALWDRKERCLLYVGMTRARDWCGVSTVKKG